MERCIKILSFETRTDAGEEFADEWQVVSPSLHGVLACIVGAASVRCHDHVFLSEHLDAERRKAVAASDMVEVRRIDRRQRTARAFARNEVRVYAHDANEDLGEHDVPRRFHLLTFRHGMAHVAEALDVLATSFLGHAELQADRVLKKLAMRPDTAGALQALIERSRLAQADADALTARRKEGVARAASQTDDEAWREAMDLPPKGESAEMANISDADPKLETADAQAPSLYERQPEMEPLSGEAAYDDAVARAVEVDAADVSPEELHAAADVFDRIVAEEGGATEAPTENKRKRKATK